MLKLRVISDLGDFERLGTIWNQVLTKSLDSDIFSTWEWIWTWWRHFGKGRQLRVLVAENNGEVVGIAPLTLSRYNFLRFGKLSRIEFMGFPQADYNNFIFVKKDGECLKLFLDGLMGFSDWDLLDLRDVREGTASSEILRMLIDDQKFKLRMVGGTLCPYINLPNSVDAFMKGLSRNMRRNLRKRMKRLRENYGVEFMTQRDFSSVDNAMETFFRLHQKRWRLKGEKGAFGSEDFRNFHLDIARVFDERGWLDLRFLAVDDEPIAAAYTFDYNLKKYGYLTGFDPEFRRFGVGNLLKLHLVEECIRRGFREYDLTRDFEPYKADWATGVRRNLSARLVRGGLSAKTYCWSLENRFSRWLINKFGVKLTIKS
ncbi:MAG: GNAT family N-acetyltransferase [Candidatus Bathycorpusculaceae bacterium]